MISLRIHYPVARIQPFHFSGIILWPWWFSFVLQFVSSFLLSVLFVFCQPRVRLFQEPYRTECISCIDICRNIYVVPKCQRHMFAIGTMRTVHGTLWIRQGLILLNVIATHLQTTRPLPGKITHIKMNCWRLGIWVHNIHFVKLVLYVFN